MEVTKNREGAKLTVSISGRLNTSTSPKLEAILKESLGGVNDLVLDLANLEYISSAGLRVVLSAQKTMNKQGSMKVLNVKPEVYEVFMMTGFVDFLDIEQS